MSLSQLGRSTPVLGTFLVLLLAGCAGAPGGDNAAGDDGAGGGNSSGGGGSIVETPYTMPPVPDVNASAMFAYYRPFVDTYGDRKGNSEAHSGSRDALEAMFEEAGLDVTRQKFTRGIYQENIVGIKWGVDRTNWVIVGGHYDTTTRGDSHDQQSNGAYDDGSGTMMTVHLAEAFADIHTYYTIAFIAFDGEERALQGSRAFYEWGLNESFPYGGIDYRAMLNLDMFGLNWPICAPIYFDDNDAQLNRTVFAKSDALGIPREFIKNQGITLGQSDYASWMRHDPHTATLFFISDFEELAAPGTGGQAGGQCLPPAEGAYPFWHNADTWDNMETMAGGPENLEAGFQTALELAVDALHFMSADPSVQFTGCLPEDPAFEDCEV